MADQAPQVIHTLQAHRDLLATFGVASLSVFGSVARGTATERSDVDLLVDFQVPVGLFAFLRLQEALEQIVQRRVDLVTRDALRPEMRAQILAEAVRAI